MSNLTGTDKSVILLMTIGEDRAAEVFKHLSQREVQTLSAAMANVTQISNKQLTDVLAEFEQEAEHFAALNINANDYLRSVLVKALGEERAASLCMPFRGIPSCANKPFAFSRHGIEYGVISGDIGIIQRDGPHAVYVGTEMAVKIFKCEVAH